MCTLYSVLQGRTGGSAQGGAHSGRVNAQKKMFWKKIMKSFNETASKIKNPGILIYKQLQDLIVGYIVKYFRMHLHSGPWPRGVPRGYYYYFYYYFDGTYFFSSANRRLSVPGGRVGVLNLNIEFLIVWVLFLGANTCFWLFNLMSPNIS